MSFIADQTFKAQDYTKTCLPKGEYENCIFEGCDFSNGYLDNQNFLECEFIDCNLSNANLKHTIFNEVTFSHCKMMGLQFEDLNDFLIAFRFEHCTLNLSSFHQMQLKNMIFRDCKLVEIDFTEADLTNAIFEHCNLARAIFDQTNLEKADFTTSIHFNIDPERNPLKKAKFSKDGLHGLLQKHNIVIV
ncbi:pentapeptide repeat-containing protein [Maribacter halichondriae]|uniref:pentapeptide repeat-containing protein n=1 Tax=Maribacter halichondriae TaxID=2980554 RepID=UPI002359E869|nr:pentapeptide repeat-containing protein [Maribacter sp. Hal144]